MSAVWRWQGQTDSAQVRQILRRRLPERPVRSAPQQVHIWVSEGPLSRAALQAEVQARWPQADVQVWACYKPLVSWLLPELAAWSAQPPQHLHLRYPVLAHAHPDRFLLEAYPLAGWAQQLGCELTTEAQSQLPGESAYALTIDSAALTEPRTLTVPLALRPAAAMTGETVQRMTGRVKVDGVTLDFLSAPEQLWEAYAGWLADHEWPQTAPYCTSLQVVARLPFAREGLGYRHEALDLGEALSEEFYFGTQEFFGCLAGDSPGGRTLQPGQVIPVVQPAEGRVELELRLNAAPLGTEPDLGAGNCPQEAEAPALPDLDRPLTPAEVQAWLRRLGRAQLGPAQPLSDPVHPPHVQSVQERPIVVFPQTRQQPGGLLVTAGQHANEATGVVAALRAVAETVDRRRLTVIAQENPDGYALFSLLRSLQHPEHMHHAARYTALGDDLEYRQAAPWYEKAARAWAVRRYAPRLHVNLHGYPAHEWTRPLSGYLPRGFEAWTLPKGFCLIFRSRPETQAEARELADSVTAALADWPELMTFNAAQCGVFEAHTDARPYEMLRGTPCLFAVREQSCPLELVTEFPDETVTGPDFRLGQAAQLAVVSAALRWVAQQGGS